VISINDRLTAGVLSVQGDVSEHIAAFEAAFEKLGTTGEARPVKHPRDIKKCDVLAIPGGESTTFSKLSVETGSFDTIRKKAKAGMPILATCAGLIMISKRGDAQVKKTGQRLMGLLDVKVDRNYFGRQIDSFETDLEISFLKPKKFRAFFIRAPIIEKIFDPGITVISRLADGTIVGVKKGNIIGLSFHPEIGGDARLHEHVLRLALRG
jgi:5'-phosphate synthase pdxT subunit